ncbi:MAG: glycerophosphodiester phosphodiesterase family protein [Myxococcaceae bacterium]
MQARPFRAAALAALAFLNTACGLADSPGEPRVIAHRSAAGYWPENSRTAVAGALAAGYPGIEIDLVLTKDLIPVVAHDPWVKGTLCTRVDGTPIGEDEDLLVRDFTLDELHAKFRCGGVRDPATPSAELVADTHLPFEEFLQMLQGHPDTWVQLDIKYEPEFTADPQTFAEKILGRWEAAGLPNRVYASANLPEVLRAFKERKPELETTLIWPRFPPESNSTTIGLGNEFSNTFGFQDLMGEIEKADADGIAVAWQVADRHALEQVRAAGFRVGLWTVNTKALLTRYCGWPTDLLITDFPEDAPCR